MTQLEAGMFALNVGQAIGIVCLAGYIKNLLNNERRISSENGELLVERDMLINKCIEIEKKVKASQDVLAVLNDLKSGGTMLHIERIDRNDVFFHQGGQYR